jgi:adenosylcobinamide amidohydrolase
MSITGISEIMTATSATAATAAIETTTTGELIVTIGSDATMVIADGITGTETAIGMIDPVGIAIEMTITEASIAEVVRELDSHLVRSWA